MLNLVKNTDTRIVTNVQELSTDNNYLFKIESMFTNGTPIVYEGYPTIENENERYVSFIINTNLDIGEYMYYFYDGDGVNTSGNFEELERGLLKITE